MKVVDAVVDHLLGNLKDVPETDYGSLVSVKEFLFPASFENYLHPKPDTTEGPVVIDESDISVLGRYYHMQSPGKVVLYKNNLKTYFDTLLNDLFSRTQHITKNDLSGIAKLVVLKTYLHEIFHFDCNVLRVMFDIQQNKHLEEALAVAWSRLKIFEERKAWQSVIGRMNEVIYSTVMEMAFDYRSPGYCDWIYFADEVRFKKGLVGYLYPQRANFLYESGVNVAGIVFSALGVSKSGQGFIEMAV